MNMVICPTCDTRVLPKLDGTCPSCLAIIPEEAREIKSKIDKTDQSKSNKNISHLKPNDVVVKNYDIVKSTRWRFWSKKTIISIPFIVLIVFIILAVVGNSSLILGSLNIVSFDYIDPSYELFFSFCTLIGPLIFVAFGYTKLAGKAEINFKLLTFWVFTAFSGLAISVFVLLEILFSGLALAQHKNYLSNPSTYIYYAFLFIGICGIVYNRYNKR